MTKKNFIALADCLRSLRQRITPLSFNVLVGDLARFCEDQNTRFDRERWLAYIAGITDQNGRRIAPPIQLSEVETESLLVDQTRETRYQKTRTGRGDQR